MEKTPQNVLTYLLAERGCSFSGLMCFPLDLVSLLLEVLQTIGIKNEMSSM